MDVHCLNCGEPWDTYHLRHDAIYDAIADGGLWPDITIAMLDADDLRQKVRERFKDQKLTDEIREAFRAVKWEFGASILVVRHCPCCKHDSKPVDEELRIKTEVTGQLLADDLDGASSILSE